MHKESAYKVGKALAARLKELIPRQQFKVPIQAAIGARIVASESIPGLLCCFLHPQMLKETYCCTMVGIHVKDMEPWGNPKRNSCCLLVQYKDAKQWLLASAWC